MNRWDYYIIKKVIEVTKRRIFKENITEYAGKTVLCPQDGNDKIQRMIQNGYPFAVSRFGSTELSVILRREAHKNHRFYKNNDINLCTLSGFFPNDERLMDQFSELMLNIVGDVDLLGVWFSSLEEYIVAEYMQSTMLTHLVAIEPYAYKNPWSKMLEGKKVLVIHPFEESIKKQYTLREKIFQNSDILPEFELKTIKAVQTIAGEKDDRFATWFDALEYMEAKIREMDFDIAIIGCGAYGMPLAVEVKRMGKQAIHMGGATQILFGIKGARWDNNPSIAGMYNEYWIRPNENERCKDGSLVEGGCYW